MLKRCMQDSKYPGVKGKADSIVLGASHTFEAPLAPYYKFVNNCLLSSSHWNILTQYFKRFEYWVSGTLKSESNYMFPVISSCKIKSILCFDLFLSKILLGCPFNPLFFPRECHCKCNVIMWLFPSLNGEVVNSINVERITENSVHPQKMVWQFTSQGCSNRLIANWACYVH